MCLSVPLWQPSVRRAGNPSDSKPLCSVTLIVGLQPEPQNREIYRSRHRAAAADRREDLLIGEGRVTDSEIQFELEGHAITTTVLRQLMTPSSELIQFYF